jgi:anthranilate 1,2-dioxygenase large subunit
METKVIDISGLDRRNWPKDQLTRVPFAVYQDKAVYQEEQRKIYHGATWNYMCLEADLKNPGDYVSTFVGETPVVAVRDNDGEIYAFENRCSHLPGKIGPCRALFMRLSRLVV